MKLNNSESVTNNNNHKSDTLSEVGNGKEMSSFLTENEEVSTAYQYNTSESTLASDSEKDLDAQAELTAGSIDIEGDYDSENNCEEIESKINDKPVEENQPEGISPDNTGVYPSEENESDRQKSKIKDYPACELERYKCPNNIAQANWMEWLSSSVDPEIIKRNVTSYEDDEHKQVSALLCREYTDKRLGGGWGVSGIHPLTGERTNESLQIKPPKPIEYADRPKPLKYISRTGKTLAPLFLEVLETNYWHRVFDDTTIPLFITEGAKKAGALLTAGLAGISIGGVWLGRKDAILHEWIKYFTKTGRKAYLCFDNDVIQKEHVFKALKDIARILVAEGCLVYVVEIPEGDAKGVDDYISAHGEDAYKKLIDDAATYEQWRKKMDAVFKAAKVKDEGEETTRRKRKEIPAADVIAAEIAEDYVDRWAFDCDRSRWLQYELTKPGVWGSVTEHYIECQIQFILDARGITEFGTDAYIRNIYKFLQRRLTIFGWKSSEGILPYLDGILHISTGKFERHRPGNRLTWSLDRKYQDDEHQDFPVILNWLQETFSSAKDLHVACCFLAAVLRQMHELEVFLFLYGEGGTGNSTFASLATMLVGEENAWSGKIQQIDEPAHAFGLIDKILAVCDDQDPVTKKELNSFKSITGGRPITVKRLYENPYFYVFTGLLLITSNFLDIFPGTGLQKWLKRRMIALETKNSPKKIDIHLLKKFEPEIAAFTKFLLSLSIEEITNTLKPANFNDSIVDLNTWKASIASESIAAWVEENIIFDKESFVRVGRNKDEWQSGDYDPTVSTLFGSYGHYCRGGGLQSKAINKFSTGLATLFKSLNLAEVTHDRDRDGAFFKGIRLRKLNEPTEQPYISDLLSGTCDEPVTNPVTDYCDEPNPCSDRSVSTFPKNQKNFEEKLEEVPAKSEQKNNFLEKSPKFRHQGSFKSVTDLNPGDVVMVIDEEDKNKGKAGIVKEMEGEGELAIVVVEIEGSAEYLYAHQLDFVGSSNQSLGVDNDVHGTLLDFVARSKAYLMGAENAEKLLQNESQPTDLLGKLITEHPSKSKSELFHLRD
ncbi:DUF3854 domain-containing protein [Fischerella sp. PCC 9605]|uniref:DUF3854 domain-containing protein n=1 Tax=Fischerella sp. PCC 9605 TaxID=1173024 RepID=UPI00047A929E|nr:DUF3854 domain-containing protein [Fischerella sp. PCC 9605]